MPAAALHHQSDPSIKPQLHPTPPSDRAEVPPNPNSKLQPLSHLKIFHRPGLLPPSPAPALISHHTPATLTTSHTHVGCSDPSLHSEGPSPSAPAVPTFLTQLPCPGPAPPRALLPLQDSLLCLSVPSSHPSTCTITPLTTPPHHSVRPPRTKTVSFFINFFWIRADLQCCVSFYYTAKRISHNMHNMHSFQDSFPI